MLKFLSLVLAGLLLGGSASAQSGSLSMSLTPTNNAYTITLPPPDSGQTRVQVNVTATYQQTVTLWDVLGTPISGYALWGNETKCVSGGLELATTDLRRARSPLIVDCMDPAGCSSVVVSTYSLGFTATLNTLSPDRTFVLSNTARAVVYSSWVWGGMPGNQTGSYAANTVDWQYLP